MFSNYEAMLAAERDVWPDPAGERVRWARRYQDSPTRFLAAFGRAAEIRDNQAVIAASAVLRDNDALNESQALSLVRALIAHGRFDEAIKVAGPLCDGGARLPKASYEMARALAGAGRFDEAAAAAAAAAAMRPDVGSAGGLGDVLERTLRLERSRDEPSFSWPDVRALLELYQGLDARACATRFVRELIETRPGPPPENTEDALAVARIGLDFLPSDVAGRLLDSLASGGIDAGVFAPLRILCEAQFCEANNDPIGAVQCLGSLSGRYAIEMDTRNAIARNVGRMVLGGASVRFVAGGRRKVFNLLPFNDELAMLRIRLDEMADWVDHFVIVEARETFTGRPKPLHFDQAKAAFAAHADKITHVVVDAFPDGIATPWARDFYQRDKAIEGLSGCCAEDDLVLITDADEIVRRSAVEDFDGQIARLTMSRYCFFLNYRPSSGPGLKRRDGPTGAIVRARHLAHHGASYLRFWFSRYRNDWCALPNAGWHFMSAKTPAAIADKYRSYAHQEHDPGKVDEAYLADRLAAIRSGKAKKGWERCEIDQSYPECIRRRPEELADLIL